MERVSIRRVRLNIPLGDVKRDAERYCAEAVELGASDAHPLGAAEVTIDERVTLKCSVPKCFGYGTCANCPPHSLKPEEMRVIVSRFRQSVVFKLEVPPEVIVRDKSTITERVEAYKKIFEIVSKLESAAFYDGYYLATGFAAGSCKSTFCYNVDCTVLKGEKCRLALRARPSMEAVGIDCYRLATMLGWEMYPLGSDVHPNCFPRGNLLGLILID